MIYPEQFEVIVVGGGHAGTEAALASARMGCKTLLLTHNIETLGQMSCNPSIGGIGKGHLVKEIDALGGIMALAADKAGIQFRILNNSKGPAVRATRAQIDRILYKAVIRKKLENQPNLTIFQQAVSDIVIKNEKVTGVVTDIGLQFNTQAVILTVGTFLDGKIHVGLDNYPGGRAGDVPSIKLAARLKELQLPQGRLKTGTPPRIDGRTIDFSKCLEQPGDGQIDSLNTVPVFSFMGKVSMHPQQISCWITKTNLTTHEIIRTGFDRSPMFTGVIEGVGPRYCPSIEDKINRFADKDSHQIFLEPEGLTTNEFYPNGISTSLPFDIQYKLVRSIKGLEKAFILRPGYAIEYNYFDPRYLKNNFENKYIENLFFAGQINGTTGYEEAAAQGLYTGINAVLKIKQQPAFIPTRDQAYLGVLIDDLISKGVTEPYRMFTSRAEYRLQLREDNADLRLTEIGRKLGLITDERWEMFCKKQDYVSRETQRLKSNWINKNIIKNDDAIKYLGKTLDKEVSLYSLLKRPNISYNDILQIEKVITKKTDTSVLDKKEIEQSFYKEIVNQIEVNTKYSGYINRQQDEIQRASNYQNLKLPTNINYMEIDSISIEIRQKLTDFKPETLGQAAKISGVTPAAISLLLIYLKKGLLKKNG